MTGKDRDESRKGAPAPAPGLYFIATPIGAARDITLRALDLLAGADVLAAEDTRTLRHLMELHGVALGDRPVVAYHDHNGAQARPRLLRALEEGKSVVYASEAGTPLVADPGYRLARAAIEAGHPIHVAPGPSAVLAALTVSGLPTDRFLFAAFPPPAAGARARFLDEIAAVPATLVLYESPKRVSKLLGELAQHLGKERPAAVCRELTKRFEEVTRGTLAELTEAFAERHVKGEIVLVIDRPGAPQNDAEFLEEALRAALTEKSLKDAVADVSAALKLPRRQVYQAALKLDGKD
ncbi:16S rRNA (cytidine(1402)-2'-O)-methyltransferase [Acidimangrovimonas pyrenivorans]|uniref:Ribosomal RNA small subunit methyltransferase I n=1 Tax=Acidimangrovimonas pyrenivorans TaxID=2030798 RepID=A0ABV7AME4_9RHOB